MQRQFSFIHFHSSYIPFIFFLHFFHHKYYSHNIYEPLQKPGPISMIILRRIPSYFYFNTKYPVTKKKKIKIQNSYQVKKKKKKISPLFFPSHSFFFFIDILIAHYFSTMQINPRTLYIYNKKYIYINVFTYNKQTMMKNK